MKDKLFTLEEIKNYLYFHNLQHTTAYIHLSEEGIKAINSGIRDKKLHYEELDGE